MSREQEQVCEEEAAWGRCIRTLDLVRKEQEVTQASGNVIGKEPTRISYLHYFVFSKWSSFIIS